MMVMATETDGEMRSVVLSNYLPDVVATESVVPAAYVWPEQEKGAIVGHDEFEEEEIPVIDFGELGSLPEEKICHQIRDAFSSWGFFQAVNHGVSLQLVERMRSVSQSFFDLPLETKEKLDCKLDGDRLFGYGFYYGSNKVKTSRRNWSEGLQVDSPRVGEFASILWPDDRDRQLEFCVTIEDYTVAVKALATRLLRLIVNSLGIYPDNYDKYAPKDTAYLRLNHYPPCPNPAVAVGLLPHQDTGLFTILHQGTVGGLQVLKDDRWVPVRPVPEAFTVNVGTILQALSNGLYGSALHRAVVNRNEDRYSVAYFVQAPDWDHIAPLPELVDAEHPALYRPFTNLEYMEIRAAGRPIDVLKCFAPQ